MSSRREGVELPRGFFEIGAARDVVALEDGSSLVTAHLHHETLMDAGANKISNRRSAEIVRDSQRSDPQDRLSGFRFSDFLHLRKTHRLACLPPGLSKIENRSAVLRKAEHVLGHDASLMKKSIGLATLFFQ